MQDGQSIMVYILYSSCVTGTYIEGAYTSKVQAEADLRNLMAIDRNNSNLWIRELKTEEHKTNI